MNNNWEDFGKLSTPRYDATATTLDQKIYVLGGMLDSDSYAEQVEIWDEYWITAKIKFSIHSACSVEQYGQILIFGGKNEEEEFVSDVWILDPEDDLVQNSGQEGIEGYFSGKSICLCSPTGLVFTDDGSLVYFDEMSCTFSKKSISESLVENKTNIATENTDVVTARPSVPVIEEEVNVEEADAESSSSSAKSEKHDSENSRHSEN